MKYIILLLAGVAIVGCTKPINLKENIAVKKKVFYRIKQVDQDGKETYSPVMYVVENSAK